MLSEKPWKTEAILRLFASVFICFLLGALISSVAGFSEGSENKAEAASFFALVVGAGGLFGGALWLLGRPLRLETLTRSLVGLLVCVYGGFLLAWLAMRLRGGAGPLNPTWKTVVAVFSFQGVALLLVWRFLREHGIGWAAAFGFKWEWKRALLMGAALAVIFLPLGWGLQTASVSLLESLHVQPQEQQAVQVLRASQGWINQFVLGVAAILVAPPAEEILFRGILYPAIKQAGYPRLALWGTAVVFGAIHWNLAIFLPLTFLALLLIWLYEKTDNLLASITAHSLFNTLNFAMLYFTEWFARFHAR